MSQHSQFYPPRSRDVNVTLIKNVRDAVDQASYDRAIAAFRDRLHPSLFAELDWMERSMPNGSDERVRKFVDNLFLHNLETILPARSAEFEIDGEGLAVELAAHRPFYGLILESDPELAATLGDARSAVLSDAWNSLKDDQRIHLDTLFPGEAARIRERFRMVRDRTALPLLTDLELRNALAMSLDKIASRMAAKRFLRENGGDLPLFEQEFASPDDVQYIGQLLQDVYQEAVRCGAFRVALACRTIREALEDVDIGNLTEFEGERAVGYGHCGTCSMMFSSTAVVSLDPRCPWLFEADKKTIHIPAGFNSAVCPFCRTRMRINAPAIFFSPKRNQLVICAPTMGQFSEIEAETVHRDAIESIISRYRATLGAEDAAAFDAARQDVVHSATQFLTAIQMGTGNRVWHSFNRVQFADGSAMILDPTTNVMIELLTPGEVHSMWDLDDGLMQTSPAPDSAGPGKQAEAPATLHEAVKAYAEGDFATAKSILEQAHAKDPANDMVSKNLATVYLALGDKAAAANLLKAG